MPELPEVETTRRGIMAALEGHRLAMRTAARLGVALADDHRPVRAVAQEGDLLGPEVQERLMAAIDLELEQASV